MNKIFLKRAVIILLTIVILSGTMFSVLAEAAVPYSPLPDYTGDWVNFRGNDENMGITEAPTPVSKENANLKWAQKYGQGWAGASTPPIIVNDVLYIVVNKNVLMLDKNTGEEIIRSPELEGNAGFALNPAAYGEGMIFVHVGEGRIQALRADTLETLWISESVGGQTISPITYKNGYIYSGTWNSETADGTYFCIYVKDEDTSRGSEIKECQWKLNHKGGFYWAGAYAADDYVIFGSDDGTGGCESETAVLYSVNPLSGKVIDTIEGIKGDMRSAIAYDQDTDKIYFSTKGGWFYSVRVKNDGTFDDKTARYMETGGMSTGTPLVYNGRAYLGVCGPGQFSKEGHTYKVIDVNEMKEIYSVEVPGYVQTSGLLSTAYADSNGKVYIYTTYNYPPGGLYVIEDSKGQTEAKAGHLFIPEGNLSQYSISSLVCDKNGTIYYKNDSCYMMAIENNKSKGNSIITEPIKTGTEINKKDKIETSLSDIKSQRGSIINFDVWATDKDGKKIDSSVTLNGQTVPKTWDDVSKTSYRLKFTDAGENIIIITAGDAAKTLIVNYIPSQEGDVIGKAAVSAEVFTLGRGYYRSCYRRY